jgi:hypothetical protein
VPDFVGFVVMILLFLPSQPLVFMGLFGKRSGALALGLVLVAGAMGIAVVLERRMKVRLGLA